MHERTVAFIKCGAMLRAHDTAILCEITKSGLRISACERIPLSSNIIDKLYAEHIGQDYYPSLVSSVAGLCSVLALVLEGDNAVSRWRGLIGPADPTIARATAPESIRARYGRELPDNAVHGSDSIESAERELEILFPSLRPLRSGSMTSPQPDGSPTPWVISPYGDALMQP